MNESDCERGIGMELRIPYYTRSSCANDYHAINKELLYSPELKMYPPESRIHLCLPPVHRVPLPPVLCIQWSGANKRYKYLAVSAKKKLSILLSSWWFRTFFT